MHSFLQRLATAIAGLVVVAGLAQAQTNREAYDLQDRCGRRAAEVFARDHENFSMAGRQHMYSYRNHYSPRLNKCFLLVQEYSYEEKSPDDGTKVLELFDLNENNKYGLYVGSTNNKRPPAGCEVQERKCTSENEWLNLVSQYMDE